MSAPQTNVATQKRWHRAPIIGMIVVVAFALGLLFWQMMKVADDGTPVDSGAAQIDGRSGDQVPDTGAPTPDVPVIPGGDLAEPVLPDPAPDAAQSPTAPANPAAP